MLTAAVGVNGRGNEVRKGNKIVPASDDYCED